MTSLGGAPSGMAGALYVSPYVLFVPSASGVIARYDTQAAFNVARSPGRRTICRKVATSVPYGFAVGGAGRRRRSVLLAPNFNDPSATYDGDRLHVLDDERDAYASAASWSSFDTTTLPGQPQGFFGAAFDGRWVYFAPQLSSASGSPAFSGVMARYDTTAAFTTAASWQSADHAPRSVAGLARPALASGAQCSTGRTSISSPRPRAPPRSRASRLEPPPATPPFASSFY